MELLYEGKAKKVYKTNVSNQILIEYKNSATAFNGLKKEDIVGKGKLNLAFTKFFYNLLESKGIKTHIVSYVDDLSLLACHLQIIPLEVVVRNFCAGSYKMRTGLEKGAKLSPPVFEIFYKNDAENDPLITPQEAILRRLATNDEILKIKSEALKINDILSEFLEKFDITLVDFKLEFGKTKEGEILLADEITPDTCRFWKKGTMESFDKDVFRENKADLALTYKKLADILGVNCEI